jgi:hypothetical protein
MRNSINTIEEEVTAAISTIGCAQNEFQEIIIK